MNRAELVGKVAEKTGVSRKVADAIIAETLETIAEAVSQGDRVVFVGFGTFERRSRKAREGRNPKTGESMTIPETIVPAFTAGKAFKEKVSIVA